MPTEGNQPGTEQTATGYDNILASGHDITVNVPRELPPDIKALHQLPPVTANWTGRAAELAELRQMVATGGVLIAGLLGMGGVGKTALAVKLTDELRADYPDPLRD